MKTYKIDPTKHRVNKQSIYFSNDEKRLIESYLNRKGIKRKSKFYRDCVLEYVGREMLKDLTTK